MPSTAHGYRSLHEENCESSHLDYTVGHHTLLLFLSHSDIPPLLEFSSFTLANRPNFFFSFLLYQYQRYEFFVLAATTAIFFSFFRSPSAVWSLLSMFRVRERWRWETYGNFIHPVFYPKIFIKFCSMQILFSLFKIIPHSKVKFI